jgi:Glycosyl transferase family 11
MTPPKHQKLFTIGRRCGRLANRLIIFANFIALAEDQGHRVVNYTFHSYSDLFEATRENIHCAYPVPKRKSWLDRIPGVGAAIRKTRIFYHFTRYASVLNERLPIFGKAVVTLRESEGQFITHLDSPEIQEKIRPAKIVFVYDWRFRAPNLAQKHGGKIRAYFRPVEKFETAARKAVDPLRQNAGIVIGVHIRQGDYRKWKGGRYFYPVERYAEWMRELSAQFPGRKVSFLVCSDEPRNAGEFPGLTVGFGTKSPVSDLYALARCDYILGAKSTFSQWASFYGEKPLLHLLDGNTPVKVENFRVSYLDWD